MGDARPFALEDLEAEAVEVEGLADLGDAPRLVHAPGPRWSWRLPSGKLPAEFAVEVADRHVALAQEAAVLAPDHARYVGIVLVLDVADDLLDDVLEGDDAAQAAIFVDHDGEMLVAGTEGLELVRTAWSPRG